MAGLTNKQRKFVEEYLTCWNASEAARRAGYRHPGQQGHRLLKNVEIQAEIRRRLSATAVGADEVLHRLAEQARGDIGELLRDDGTIDLAGAKAAGRTRLLKSISDTDRGLRIEMYDAQRALELLGKHHGLFAGDRPAVTVNFNLDEWQRQREERRKQLDELAEPDECAATDGES